MNQTRRLEALLCTLRDENPRYRNIVIPQTPEERRQLFRALVNIRPPKPVDDDFLALQDAYLREEIRARGITDALALPAVPGWPQLALWRGDMTALRAGAIVNAANSAMLGCFVPGHGCIDNAIHTYAGVQLRLACAGLMKKQGHEEPVGGVRVTKGYNLPSRYIFHTVGPIVEGPLAQSDCELLASCYRSCLTLALQRQLDSIAFCCISTGEFKFPPQKAAEIAVATVQDFLRAHKANIKVIFNVFKESDREIYSRLFAGNLGPETGA